MKILRFTGLAALLAMLLCSCETSDGGRKKKRTRPPLPGETESDLSWSRPTKSSEISSPFGLPTSR
jgi:hypothetical protein